MGKVSHTTKEKMQRKAKMQLLAQRRKNKSSQRNNGSNRLERPVQERKTKSRILIDTGNHFHIFDDLDKQKECMGIIERPTDSLKSVLDLYLTRPLEDGTFVQFYKTIGPCEAYAPNILGTAFNYDPGCKMSLKEIKSAAAFYVWVNQGITDDKSVYELIRGNVLCLRVDENGDELGIKTHHLEEFITPFTKHCVNVYEIYTPLQ